MDIGEKIQIIEEGFVHTIKPLVEEGKIQSAYREMQNLTLALLAQLKQISRISFWNKIYSKRNKF